jgi:hypothetical protein
MPSQTDLDQGGISRQWLRSYMGPSVGWIYVPLQNVLLIGLSGTYILDPSISLVEINNAGTVTITLPSAANPGGSQPQQALFAKNAITFIDIGGNAAAHPITIQRNNPSDSIMGGASIQITTNFGSLVLQPNPALQSWNSV